MEIALVISYLVQVSTPLPEVEAPERALPTFKEYGERLRAELPESGMPEQVD
jgi:hypothetical protein